MTRSRIIEKTHQALPGHAQHSLKQVLKHSLHREQIAMTCQFRYFKRCYDSVVPFEPVDRFKLS